MTKVDALLAFSLLPLCASVVCGTAVRANATEVVPIQEVRLSDDTLRYSIPLRIGGVPVAVGLDTGSVGLRLLPGAQDDVTGTSQIAHVQYSSAVTLDGVVAHANVKLGTFGRTIDVQAIDEIGCGTRPGDFMRSDSCVGDTFPIDDFRLLGNRNGSEGFFAILGTKFGSSTQLPNPLVQLGVHRWIVRLPLPGDESPGTLTLNPTGDEMQGFVPLARGSIPASVSACIIRDSDMPAKICAPTILDTGAPGITIVNGTDDGDWKPGVDARLAFATASADRLPSINFQTDNDDLQTQLRIANGPRAGVEINAGLFVYYNDDVLYDADRGTISIRPRA